MINHFHKLPKHLTVKKLLQSSIHTTKTTCSSLGHFQISSNNRQAAAFLCQ